MVTSLLFTFRNGFGTSTIVVMTIYLSVCWSAEKYLFRGASSRRFADPRVTVNRGKYSKALRNPFAHKVNCPRDRRVHKESDEEKRRHLSPGTIIFPVCYSE